MRLRILVPLILLVPVAPSAPQAQTGMAWEKPIAPGLVYRMEIDRQTPRQIHALRLTPTSPGLRWQAQLAGQTVEEEGTMKGRLTPSDFAAKEGALAVVNGDFFSFDHGAPIGMTVRGGQLLNSPARARAIFAWGANGSAVGFGAVRASLAVPGREPASLDAVNQPIGDNGLVLYTAAQGRLVPPPGATLVALDVPNVIWSPRTSVKASVASVSVDPAPLTVPEGRAYLMATGTRRAALDNLRVDQTVTVRLETPGLDWDKFENAIGGGPYLLRDGKVAIDAAEEGFNATFSTKRHPRTAIGRTVDGDVWIVAIDGRQAHSDGATLEETAQILRRLGCVDAINLDGGGSTALNVRGLTVNHPSDAKERPVANGIVIFGPKPAAPTGKLRLEVGPRFTPDGAIAARVDLDGKPVPDIDILWTARGPAWVDPAGRVQFTKAGPATLYARVYGQTLQAEVEWTPGKEGGKN
jgi:hypothetical protein